MTAYFTLVGTSFRQGHDFLEPGMTLTLKKEPDNDVDKEAIQVTLAGMGVIGYVANSPRTVVGDAFSAGRLYDKIGDTATAEVLYKLPNAAQCKLELPDPVSL